MGVYIWNKLPSAYQEVEYIQSSGTQYIDTGIKPTNNTKIVSKLYMTSGAYQILCGVGRAGYYQSMSIYIDGTSYKYIGRWRSSSSSNSTVSSSVIATGTTPHIFESSQSDGFYIDGTKIGTFTSYSFTESYNMYLFGWNNYGSVRDLSSGAIYYFKIYESGTLVRDFVPCYRKSDDVIGMYDLVNNQFYTNSGSGTFTKGSDVNTYREKELKNAYIGEVWTPTSNTLAYYPFTDNQLDVTGKTTLPISGTLQPIGCRFSVSGSYNYQISVSEQPNFFSFWLKVNSFGSQGNIGGIGNNKYLIQYYINHNNGTWVNKIVVRGANNTLVNGPSNISQWNHICFGGDGNNYIVGVNGNITNITDTPQSITSQMFQLVSTYNSAADFDISEMIVESKARTAQEIADYYNQTKSNYGL